MMVTQDNDSYYASRADAMHTIESTIGLYGGDHSTWDFNVVPCSGVGRDIHTAGPHGEGAGGDGPEDRLQCGGHGSQC